MKKLLILFIGILSFNPLYAQKYTETYIKDATLVGQLWWDEINNGEYEKSYYKLSDILKDRFTLENWKTQISMLIEEFGVLKYRKLINAKFQSELEGFSDGFYVLIEYNVNYSKTQNHTENLLLKQSDKLEWEIFDFNYEFQNLEIEE